MPTGLALPPGVDSQGRGRRVTGPDQTKKILLLHLSPGGSTNPFQKVGMDDVTFDLTPRAERQVKNRVRELFERFAASNRAKLLGEPTSQPATSETRTVLDVSYQSLEEPPTASPRSLQVPLRVGAQR